VGARMQRWLALAAEVPLLRTLLGPQVPSTIVTTFTHSWG